MSLSIPFPYNTTYKLHLFIAFFLGVLLSFILIALQPFNLSQINREHEAMFLLGFGLLKFISYLSAHFISNRYYKKTKKWTLWNEVIFLISSSILGIILSYVYLDLIFENHPLSLNRLLLFFYYIGLPLFPLVLFPKAVLRYLLIKDLRLTENNANTETKLKYEELTLKGQSSNDQLTISKEDLLYVKSLDNYVVINYKNEDLESKILRARLSDIREQAPFLIQPHRSYLINPDHSFKLKGNSQKSSLSLSVINETIPVSRSSYKSIKPLFS
ncbi:LytTR family DNA-binding domain-containing protein [Tenacibaculum xiamenense]|uniref:LytTR family DNA-binding domain-containing protein n=1 Tax=Tenacibaculum xiamenense TaxID=1261553 RepID=UPI0038936E49